MKRQQQLITTINDLANTKYIKKDKIFFVKDNLEIIKESTTNQESKHIDTVIDLISKQKLKIEDIKKLKQVKPIVIKIVKKYEEEYNEEPNEDEIDNKLTIEEVENKLDEKIPEYNGFDENHPMKGVTLENINRYKIQYGNIKSHAKNISNACNKIIEFSGYKNSKIFGKNIPKKYFIYSNHYFVSYWDQNEPYFDIQHIISVLNLKKSSWNDKYKEFCNEIEYYLWHPNLFGGYILRELINEQTVYKLILSSNSTLSKSFKKDIAKILADLRKEDLLEITNEKISKKKKNISGMNENN